MQAKHRHLVLCVAGIALPDSQFIPFLLQDGFNMRLFVDQLFANRISAFFGFDVLVSAVTLWIFVGREGARLGLKHLWVPLVVTLTVGVSFGLPLFLYMREAAIAPGPLAGIRGGQDAA